jgi:hypothetical protein
MISASLGAEEMKFTLVYDGRLDSQNSGDIFNKRWEIRQYLAPQLEELWRVYPGLEKLNPYVPRDATYLTTQSHHSTELDPRMSEQKAAQAAAEPEKWINVFEPIDVRGIRFLPLIRETLALSCSLKIIFMRKERPGRIYTGDLDNRIKTFLDSLKVPKSEADCVANVYPKPTEPIRCLVEDDSLITGLNVETTRLLSSDGGEKNYVRLVVEVLVHVMYPRTYNELFLGD